MSTNKNFKRFSLVLHFRDKMLCFNVQLKRQGNLKYGSSVEYQLNIFWQCKIHCWHTVQQIFFFFKKKRNSTIYRKREVHQKMPPCSIPIFCSCRQIPVIKCCITENTPCPTWETWENRHTFPGGAADSAHLPRLLYAVYINGEKQKSAVSY